ncbi:MAG TPA: VWA domain-containing protein, partial [Blastocatellia bacterium]
MKKAIGPVCIVLLILLMALIPHASNGRELGQTGNQSGKTAQTQADQSQTIKLKTSLVEVHAVVTDRGGRPVENLNKDDFDLTENGARQEISFFSVEHLGNTPARPTGETPANPAQPRPVGSRVLVLFVDNLHMAAGSVIAVKQQLRQFVDEQVTDRDAVLVVTTAGSLGTLQRFTHDKNVLRLAIDKIAVHKAGTDSEFTPYIAAQIQQGDPRALALGLQLVIREDGYVPCNCQADPAYVKARAALVLANESGPRRATLATLKAVCDLLADLTGERLIAVASDGFTTFDETGMRDTLDMSSVTGRAAQHGILIYSLAAQGLATPPESQATHALSGTDILTYLADSRLEEQQVMRTLAADTGGEAFLNTNNMNNSLGTMLDNNRTYYTLGYYPPDDKNPNKVRSLAVKVKGHPEYVVRAQKGYLPAERNSADALATPQQRLFKAMIAPVPATGIGVTAGAAFLERESDGTQVTVQIHIDADTLEYQKQGDDYLLHCEVAGSVFDSAGKVAGDFAEGVQATLTAAELDQVKKTGYRYTRHLELKPGLYDVRVGVMEGDAERIGTSTTSIEVPDVSTGKLALSSVILSKPDQEEPPIEMLVGKMPAGTPSFKAGSSASYHLVAYNLQPDAEPDLTVNTQILQNEKVVRETSTPFAAKESNGGDNGIETSGTVDLSLPPGSYTLHVSIKNAKSKETAEQTVEF